MTCTMLPILVDMSGKVINIVNIATVEKLSTNLYFFLSTLDLMKKAEMGDGKHDSEVCVVAKR